MTRIGHFFSNVLSDVLSGVIVKLINEDIPAIPSVADDVAIDTAVFTPGIICRLAPTAVRVIEESKMVVRPPSLGAVFTASKEADLAWFDSLTESF